MQFKKLTEFVKNKRQKYDQADINLVIFQYQKIKL